MSPPASLELLLKRIDGEDELHERRLAINYDTEIMIGRASKTEQKQLVPAVDNGWIRNPVISRHHAVLTLEPSEAKPGVVYIQDKKSSHGTYVNGENIQLNKRPLQDGDKIRFGSEVMRGEETFRPPVFSFETSQIGLTFSAPSPEITIIEDISTIGKTISVPVDSDVESDSEDDSPIIEPASSSSSSSSQAPMSSVNPGSFLGSQTNPLTIDEADMIPDSEFFKAQEDDASSESNISLLYDDDLKDEGSLDIDTDEDEEVEDIDDEEESENDDHDSEGIAESPIYTPKSPRYIPNESESYDRISRDYNSAQYGNETGYVDGPFAYSRPSWPSNNNSNNNQAFVAAPQPWEMEVVKQPARPTNFPMISPPTEKLVPQYSLTFPSNLTPVVEPISRTTTTRDLIDENRRAYNKADMSIRNLINPSPSRESNITGTKRKAETLDLDLDEEETLVAMLPKQAAEIASSHVPVEIETSKLPKTPESPNKEPIETPMLDAVAPSDISAPVEVTAERPRKKQKLRAMMNKVALFSAGVMVGSAGMLGGLMSLPDGFFQA